MLETVIVDRIITELFSVGKSTKDTDELLSLFGSKTKELFGVDEVKVSSTYPDGVILHLSRTMHETQASLMSTTG